MPQDFFFLFFLLSPLSLLFWEAEFIADTRIHIKTHLCRSAL
jgi:hypothetical protein